MRKLFTILIFITRVCLGEPEAKPASKPVLKRTAAPKKEAPKPAVLPHKPDAVIELIAPAKPIELADISVMTAIRLSQEMRRDPVLPVRGPYGSVLYEYGSGEPTLVCAPFRVCFLELERGEQILGKPHIGDSVRWEVSPSMFGGEDESAAVLLFKPTDAHVETNVVFMTNRRPYSVRLISRQGDYVARVAFKYPEDDAKKWAAAVKPPPPPQAKILPAIIAAEKLNFRYRIKGGSEHTRPTRVYDDGTRTFLAMPASMASREAPSLLVIGEDGKGILSNYRVQNGTYIVDRLFDEAHLVLGTSKKAKKVKIERAGNGV